MINVSLTNHSPFGMFVDGGNMIIPEKISFSDWRGNHTMNVVGMGDIAFIDMGDLKLNQYTNPQLPWTQFPIGGLIRYRGLEAYFRYKDKGQVDVAVDFLGNVQLHLAQGGMIVRLDDLTVK